MDGRNTFILLCRVDQILAFVDIFPLLSYFPVDVRVIRFGFFVLYWHQEGVDLYCYGTDPASCFCLEHYLIGPVILGLGKDNCVLCWVDPKLFHSDIRRPSTRNTLQLPLRSDLDKKSQLAAIDKGNCLRSHCTECGIYNNLYVSGAPTREARVGRSPIRLVYGQPLFVWLSRDWPSVCTGLRIVRMA